VRGLHLSLLGVLPKKCSQYLGVDRFHQMVLEASGLGAAPVLRLPVARHCNDERSFQLRHPPQLLGHRVAIHPGQSNIEKNHLGPKTARHFQGCLPIVGHFHVVSPPLREERQ
jgi:hypothetical protein